MANSILSKGQIGSVKRPKPLRKTFGMPGAMALARGAAKSKGPGIYAKLNKVKKL